MCPTPARHRSRLLADSSRLRTSQNGHRKTPQETRRLYRRSDEWLYRVQITKDHLRGSGTSAPVAIAGLLGLAFGETCELETAAGGRRA